MWRTRPPTAWYGSRNWSPGHQVTSVAAVQSLLKFIHPEFTVPAGEIAEWQRLNVNQHVKQLRDPDSIWKYWTDDQRSTFLAFCGEAMSILGYRIPSRP